MNSIQKTPKDRRCLQFYLSLEFISCLDGSNRCAIGHPGMNLVGNLAPKRPFLSAKGKKRQKQKKLSVGVMLRFASTLFGVFVGASSRRWPANRPASRSIRFQSCVEVRNVLVHDWHVPSVPPKKHFASLSCSSKASSVLPSLSFRPLVRPSG